MEQSASEVHARPPRPPGFAEPPSLGRAANRPPLPGGAVVDLARGRATDGSLRVGTVDY